MNGHLSYLKWPCQSPKIDTILLWILLNSDHPVTFIMQPDKVILPEVTGLNRFHYIH